MSARVASLVRLVRFISLVSLVAGGVMSASCLQPVTVAELTLQVREPFGINRRASEVTTVAWSVNGVDDSVSFIAGTPVATSPIPLGVANQVVDVSVLLGANPAEPTAIGRANRTPLPRIDEAEVVEGAALALNAFVFLAAPNLAEPLDNGVPAARTGTAACDNDDGRVRVVGGQQNNAYRFELDLLRVTGAFNFEADAKSVACDISDKDVPIAVRATCPGGTSRRRARARHGGRGGHCRRRRCCLRAVRAHHR